MAKRKALRVWVNRRQQLYDACMILSCFVRTDDYDYHLSMKDGNVRIWRHSIITHQLHDVLTLGKCGRRLNLLLFMPKYIPVSAPKNQCNSI